MDITSIVPVSDTFVVAGDSVSGLTMCRAPARGLVELPLRPQTCKTVASIGKCSAHPVKALDALGNHVAAAASAVSVWDITACRRLVHYTENANNVAYMRPNLVAAVGDACQLSLFDVRLPVRAFSRQVALDNLYAVAVEDAVVFCGGADGNIYRIDLRNQQKEVWQIGKEAVLDIHVVDGNSLQNSGWSPHKTQLDKVCGSQMQLTDSSLMSSQSSTDFSGNSCVPGLSGHNLSGMAGPVALLESGTVCGFGDAPFSIQVCDRLAHHVKCDIEPGRIVCGSETGAVRVFDQDRTMDVRIHDGLVAAVRWCDNGFYASCGEDVVMVEMP